MRDGMLDISTSSISRTGKRKFVSLSLTCGMVVCNGDEHGSALTPENAISQLRASVTLVTISRGCAHARKSSTNHRNSSLFDHFYCASLFLLVLHLRKPTQARRTVPKTLGSI